jgi:hypothetical protein
MPFWRTMAMPGDTKSKRDLHAEVGKNWCRFRYPSGHSDSATSGGPLDKESFALRANRPSSCTDGCRCDHRGKYTEVLLLFGRTSRHLVGVPPISFCWCRRKHVEVLLLFGRTSRYLVGVPPITLARAEQPVRRSALFFGIEHASSPCRGEGKSGNNK